MANDLIDCLSREQLMTRLSDFFTADSIIDFSDGVFDSAGVEFDWDDMVSYPGEWKSLAYKTGAKSLSVELRRIYRNVLKNVYWADYFQEPMDIFLFAETGCVGAVDSNR